MIVNYTDKGWEVITQRAHGILAAQLGIQWKVEERPQRWLETILAIAEHDDAEVELDGENLLTEQGGPLNFAMKKFELEHCKKLSRFSITKSRYIALLTSMHMDFLHRSEESTNEQVKVFLANQRKMQDEWLQELNLQKETAEKIYSLLEWCDAFSLLLCRNQIQPEQRSIEISDGPDGTKYYLQQVEDNKLTLHPWPFDSSSFKVYYESRIISQLHFKNSAEFRIAFQKATINETVWELIKAESTGTSTTV